MGGGSPSFQRSNVYKERLQMMKANSLKRKRKVVNGIQRRGNPDGWPNEKLFNLIRNQRIVK